jgi:hypothetical protein
MGISEWQLERMIVVDDEIIAGEPAEAFSSLYPSARELLEAKRGPRSAVANPGPAPILVMALRPRVFS